jgi:hypothetical protein
MDGHYNFGRCPASFQNPHSILSRRYGAVEIVCEVSCIVSNEVLGKLCLQHPRRMVLRAPDQTESFLTQRDVRGSIIVAL